MGFRGLVKLLQALRDDEMSLLRSWVDYVAFDGMTTGKGGAMKIYVSAAQPSRSPILIRRACI